MKEEKRSEQQDETTNGVKINVEDLGGTGKPVVFIHGLPMNHNMFEYQFGDIAFHFYYFM